MEKLYYCGDCKRVLNNDIKCQYCTGDDIRELTVKSPVNVIGTKIKGNVLKIKEGNVNIIIRNEANDKLLKTYKADQLRKVL